eukprot:6201335-Pleurochrysis_carterae.AAC.3
MPRTLVTMQIPTYIPVVPAANYARAICPTGLLCWRACACNNNAGEAGGRAGERQGLIPKANKSSRISQHADICPFAF